MQGKSDLGHSLKSVTLLGYYLKPIGHPAGESLLLSRLFNSISLL